MSRTLPFDAWLDCVENEQEGVLATALQEGESNKAGRIFFSKEGQSVGTLGDLSLDKQAEEIAVRKLHELNPKSESVTLIDEAGQEADIFMDVYVPPSTLLIFGAGHDAIPVAKHGASLGMRTIVVDPRPAYNNEERFPEAHRVIADSVKFKEKVHISSRTYVVVMNHHLERDQETLKFVLRSSAPYVGVLGPRSRRIRMMEAIEGEGVEFEEEQLAKMYSPIGLDIGAVTPEEIAISILAEIIAVKTGHKGGFLQGAEHIHQVAK
ncbi:XdhC family protein [Bacillus thermotolerans]|uniref:XdhC family protein n=1 Tax=Bacillus thermotolerans TaxID=1221996 RepID=UPI000582D81B|nr:XdhC family protein [Bacillus thermotolerans]KKB36915.1 Xanthine and CO dehydrogenases maturation factor, XdhC/CoxF family [Bacillus thermotolerans]